MQEKNWYLYLLECLDSSYYIGITNNIEKRMSAHAAGKGSKYVRARGFKSLLASKIFPSKSEALKTEYEVKQLPKEAKLAFFK